MVDTWLGGGGRRQPDAMERMFYRGERTRPAAIMGTSERFVDINFAKMLAGRVFTRAGSAAAQPVAVIGYGVYEALFEKRGIDPIGKPVRIGARRIHGARRHRQAAVAGRLQPAPGRLRHHSLHRVPQAVRQRNACGAGRSAVSR